MRLEPAERQVGRGGRERVTIVVAQGDAHRRTGVCRGLERHGFAVVGEAGDADSAVAVASEYRPSMCLLDVDIPGDGIVAADRIVALVPNTKIAILAETTTEDEVLRAIRAGADGYLPRRIAPDRLSAALRGVLGGEAAVPRAITSTLVEAFRTGQDLDTPRRRRLHGGSRLMFVPRFIRHFYRRLRRGELPGPAWTSARRRMLDYR